MELDKLCNNSIKIQKRKVLIRNLDDKISDYQFEYDFKRNKLISCVVKNVIDFAKSANGGRPI